MSCLKAYSALLLVALCCDSAGSDDTQKSELARLQGNWEIVSCDRDGVSYPDEVGGHANFDEGSAIVKTTDGKHTKYRIVLRPDQSPKSIDWIVSQDGQQQILRGIYDIDDGTLTTCSPAGFGLQRPSQLATEPGDGRWLFVLKRPGHGKTGISQLRLFNTGVFGKSAAEPIRLLEPVLPGQITPETVMLDVDKGRYVAATVHYPKAVTFDEARRSLNKVYAKYEKDSFADDPNMGLWRNEDDGFAIQLTADENDLVVIYISFSLLTGERFGEALNRALPFTAEPPDE